MFEEIRKNNRQQRIVLHYDSASCHTSFEITRFLKGQKIELTGYPPYSPDLAPNDFYLFPSTKNKLRGQRFWSRKEAVDAHVLEIFKSEWKKCYNNWFRRMQKCIDHHENNSGLLVKRADFELKGTGFDWTASRVSNLQQPLSHGLNGPAWKTSMRCTREHLFSGASHARSGSEPKWQKQNPNSFVMSVRPPVRMSQAKDRFPRIVIIVILAEFCERFSYSAMRAELELKAGRGAESRTGPGSTLRTDQESKNGCRDWIRIKSKHTEESLSSYMVSGTVAFLTLYLRSKLGYSDDGATEIYHIFSTFVYVFPFWRDSGRQLLREI
ncbi:Histone-lysine N-methyltransferase SETMAR [Eumeta japonica]|uniref:Histone-lysine N-methyltransferase SETMAR n=1 Tax=Eumeta variegata TaxID=151549 RepID=A0A4C1TZJ0_EUMVA|nr:Histone-lysine N-methyltransferase SETMAR [Eumeta japonica]